ncbi:MAG: DUF4363 family protein [Candidatus Saccharibacteria bacterium]
MRMLGILLVVLALVVAGGLWSNKSLDTSARQITSQIDNVSAAIKSDKWDKAQQSTISLESTWGRKSKWWPVFLDHEEMDNIQFAMARTRQYVANRNYPLSMGQLAELRVMINHVPRKEAVTWENIL